MSITHTSKLEDRFSSVHLDGNEQGRLLPSSDMSYEIIPHDNRPSSTVESAVQKLTKVVKEAFVNVDNEEKGLLVDFEESDIGLTTHEIVDLTITVIDRSAAACISIKDLELLQQRHPNIREAVFSRIDRKGKEFFDVSSWQHLRKLSLQYFDLTTKELRSLSKSKGITHLDLANAQKELNSTEWTYIASLKNLESLSLRRCSSKEKDICYVLKNSTKIRHLALAYCQGISSEIVKKISLCTQLTSFQLHLLDESKEGSLESLERLVNLEDLELSGNWLNIHLLGCLTNLKSLSLHKVNMTDRQLVGVISNLPNLERLTLTKMNKLTNRVVDFIGKYLIQLNYLDLSHCTNVNNVTSLASLKGLKHLNLSACLRINDLSLLKSLDKLEYLNLNNLCLLDYSFIAFLGNLKYLNLSFCDIKDISFLSKLERLECLDVIQSFHAQALDLRFVPIQLDSFKQLVVSQDDKILRLVDLDERLQNKIQKKFIPSRLRDYI